MRERSNPFIIFSVTHPEWKDTLQEGVNNETAREQLNSQGILYKEVRGRYRGMDEEAFLVHAKHEKAIKVLAGMFRQKCILYVNEDRYGCFVYLANDEHEYVGKFVKTTKAEVLEQTGYTYDPIEDQYYTLTGGSKHVEHRLHNEI